MPLRIGYGSVSRVSGRQGLGTIGLKTLRGGAALARLREGDVTIPAGRIQRAVALVLADQAAAEP
jgi:hypothetical protein